MNEKIEKLGKKDLQSLNDSAVLNKKFEKPEKKKEIKNMRSTSISSNVQTTQRSNKMEIKKITHTEKSYAD